LIPIGGERLPFFLFITKLNNKKVSKRIMTATVLSGSGGVTWNNPTPGQNARVIINYMAGSSITLAWSSASATTTGTCAFGRNLAYFANSGSSNGSVAQNMISGSNATSSNYLPTELMLSPGQTFSASGCTAYNIVIIPEAG
jgi:hypothetical protein